MEDARDPVLREEIERDQDHQRCERRIDQAKLPDCFSRHGTVFRLLREMDQIKRDTAYHDTNGACGFPGERPGCEKRAFTTTISNLLIFIRDVGEHGIQRRNDNQADHAHNEIVESDEIRNHGRVIVWEDSGEKEASANEHVKVDKRNSCDAEKQILLVEDPCEPSHQRKRQNRSGQAGEGHLADQFGRKPPEVNRDIGVQATLNVYVEEVEEQAKDNRAERRATKQAGKFLEKSEQATRAGCRAFPEKWNLAPRSDSVVGKNNS